MTARSRRFSRIEQLSEVDDWTAERALALLPETNGPRVEVFRGSVIVSPHASIDHQTIMRELSYLLNKAARAAGCWAYPEVNVISADDLFIPDLVVSRAPSGGRVALPISEAVLLAEIVSPGNRRKDVIERPREYAAAGVPWFLRIEFQRRVVSLALHEFRDGAYQPVLVAATGDRFVMTEPFAFEIDPRTLLDG